MSQYQTFPGAPGHSRTLDKLKALRLPAMGGLRFLDVGCNEGFFCGFAKFDGAAVSIGIDSSEQFLERARDRFPECEFLHRNWEDLPEGQFDVVLLASALHYAEDQADLIRHLMSRVAPSGVLVLELGLAASVKPEWVTVKRGIDQRTFPTMRMLEEILKDFAWKWVGPSVLQQGDPVARHVIHVHHKRPVAYLLMQPPGYGKSSIARALFGNGNIPVVSGDQVLLDVAQGRVQSTPELTAAVSMEFSSLGVDVATRRVLDAGLAPELVNVWVRQARNGDFALDAYVPNEEQDRVEEVLRDLGYMTVRLQWERPGFGPAFGDSGIERADAYYEALLAGIEMDSEGRKLQFSGTVGFVDELHFAHGLLTVRGWAVHESGSMPALLAVRTQAGHLVIDRFERMQRPDVQVHLNLAHDVCGFRFSVQLDGRMFSPGARTEFAVFGGNELSNLSGPFPFAAAGPAS